jgi:hypothetical protein
MTRAFLTRRRALLPALALTLALASAAGCASLDEQQRKWVFQPSKESWWGASSSAGMQDVWIDFRSKEAY